MTTTLSDLQFLAIQVGQIPRDIQMTRGELAQAIGVSIHTLIKWEKQTLSLPRSKRNGEVEYSLRDIGLWTLFSNRHELAKRVVLIAESQRQQTTR